MFDGLHQSTLIITSFTFTLNKGIKVRHVNFAIEEIHVSKDSLWNVGKHFGYFLVDTDPVVEALYPFPMLGKEQEVKDLDSVVKAENCNAYMVMQLF